MGGGCDMHIIHDDTTSYFAEGMDDGVLSDAGRGENAGMWSDFTAVADNGGSDNVAACVNFGVFSYGDGAFDGDSFFDGAAGVFTGGLDHCLVDGDEVPGVDDIHP